MNDKLNAASGSTKTGIDNAKNKSWKREDCEKWLKPLYLGLLDDHGGCGASTISNGDLMRIFLKFEEDKVIQATFQTDGSAASSICGFFAAELAMGKSPDEIGKVTAETVIEFMGGLPEEDRQCAFLAAESLRRALQHYMVKQETTNRRSWQKPCLVAVKPAREREGGKK
jgi:nitrogen fixation protein NifU and related proteins